MNLQALEIFKQSEHYRQQRNWLNHELRPAVCLKMASLPEKEADVLLSIYLTLIDQASRLRQHSHYAHSRIFSGGDATRFLEEFKAATEAYNRGLDIFKTIMGIK